MINYNNKKFRPVATTGNGEVGSETVFHYKQEENIVTSVYSGDNIKSGHLIAVVREEGVLDMRYHQVNAKGEVMTGTCESTPEILENGKLKLHEKWKWTSGDGSEGNSVLEEI